jgi:RES domain-containing protein
MIVFRLCRETWCRDLSGGGAREYGGRWNSKGVPMLYTGETRALCTTELAVHLPYGLLPENYFMMAIQFPSSVKPFIPSRLPDHWNEFPYLSSTQELGDRFVEEGKHLVMRVPSAVVQGEHNFLFNPRHELMKQVEVHSKSPFWFDGRLFTR